VVITCAVAGSNPDTRFLALHRITSHTIALARPVTIVTFTIVIALDKPVVASLP
jgi:hypothetical protein